MTKTLLAAAAITALATVLPAHADIAVGSAAFSYSQTFDSLTTSTATQPWTNDVTLAGWSLFNSTFAAITTYVGGDGSSNTGSFFSYGAVGSGERALGGLASGGAYFGSPASGALAGWMAVAFNNATGAALNGFTLRFNGEQWRNGGNTSAQTMVLQYGFGATFASVASWATPGGGFDWASPVIGASAATVNGNAAGLVVNVGGSVGTSWAAGSTLWLRWADNNDVGNDHGLAIDNLSFSVTAVPEPGAWALLLAGLAVVGFISRRQRVGA